MDRDNDVEGFCSTFNKAGYTAQDAPSTRKKITGDGRTDGRTQPRIEMRWRI